MDGNSSASSRIYLNPSCFAVKSNGDLALVNNDRNLTHAVGIFQHSVHPAGIKAHIIIFHFPAFLGKSFTSLSCIGSGILAVNHYFFLHVFSPCSGDRLKHTKIICCNFKMLYVIFKNKIFNSYSIFCQ